MNDIFSTPSLDRWLTPHGKKLCFPLDGIVKQAGDGYGKRINATAGVAHNNEGNLLTLPSLQQSFGNNTNVLNYAPTPGIKALREIWLQEMLTKNPSLKNATITLPIVTNGLTHGVNIAGQLFLAPGDAVIVSDKYWDNYRLMFEMGLNANLITYSLFDGNGYNLPGFCDLVQKSPVGKKFIILNVPNNPTGYSPTQEEQDAIIEILLQSADAGNELVILCDDAYFGLNYTNDIAPESAFARLANAHENILAIKIDGATKEEFAWGLRVGFITLGGKSLNQNDLDILENKMCGVIRSNASNGCHPSQEALLKALQTPNHDTEKKEAAKILKERFEIVQNILTKHAEKYASCFTPLPANSGYFVCLELDEKIDGEQVRQTLLKKYDIAVIAVENWIRVAYSSVRKTDLPELFDAIYAACAEQL